MSDEGFLSRWSRRKVEVKQGVAPVEVPPTSPHPTPLPAGERELTSSLAPPGRAIEAEGPAPSAEDPPPPTMDGVKRAAMKKLFSDPHFNVMDGLDTYIDDYGRPDPIPESMLRRMTQSAFLGLFDHEAEAKASPDGEAPSALSQSPSEPEVSADEDTDLRLQQDDAAGPVGTDEGPRR
ncbi:MAG: DUF3306 domain-containing protein [Betaproteobacteria bacterium]|nr:MAG: DUF3306 domain-containing protein [Betaproteobacteria bacterium]